MMKKKYKLDPAISIKIQEDFGGGYTFAFDECTSPLHSYDYNKNPEKLTVGRKMLKGEKKTAKLFWHSAGGVYLRFKGRKFGGHRLAF